MQHEHPEQFETFTNQYISQSFAASLAFGLEQDCKGYTIHINERVLMYYDHNSCRNNSWIQHRIEHAAMPIGSARQHALRPIS